MKISEMQKIELNMLECFHDICINNKLTYYIVGGTMLGAIRHNGFIPWDDDIDVVMPRKDYDQFLLIAKQLLPSYLTILSPGMRHYYHFFAKIVNVNTAIVEPEYIDSAENIGVHIDIFPLDNVLKRKSFWLNYIDTLKVFHSLDAVKASARTTKLKVFVANIYFHMVKCIPWRTGKIEKKVLMIDKICSRYKNEDSDLVANLLGVYKEKEIMPKTYFGTPTLYLFEDLRFFGVEKYDLFLKQLYGDYMSLPSLEKQVSHHTYIASYKEGYNINNCMR